MKFGLSDLDIDKIHSVFRKYPQITSVVLYGSRAKGNYRPGSDIDLTINGNGLDVKAMNRVSIDLDDLLLPYKFDLSIYDMLQNKDIVDHIQRVGTEFYKGK